MPQAHARHPPALHLDLEREVQPVAEGVLEGADLLVPLHRLEDVAGEAGEVGDAGLGRVVGVDGRAGAAARREGSRLERAGRVGGALLVGDGDRPRRVAVGAGDREEEDEDERRSRHGGPSSHNGRVPRPSGSDLACPSDRRARRGEGQASRSAEVIGSRAPRSAGSRPPRTPITTAKRHPDQDDPGRDAEGEGDLAEALGLAGAGREAVHREGQQAADRAADQRRGSPTRSGTRRGSRGARSRARAGCRSRACARPRSRTWC